MKLIYGSTAIKRWFPDYEREPHDLDIISDEGNTNSDGVEYYWIPEFEWLRENNISKEYVDPNNLFTIKVSHAAWNINWIKHMKDIHFMQDRGCVLVPEFYQMLFKAWERIHKGKHFTFDKPTEEFFKDSVARLYNHDELHEVFKFYEEPLYKKILVHPDRALCSEEKFNELSHQDKVRVALEEIVVLAHERYVIPHDAALAVAVRQATKDLITHMSKGWFNLFLILNSREFLFPSKENLTHIKHCSNIIEVEKETLK